MGISAHGVQEVTKPDESYARSLLAATNGDYLRNVRCDYAGNVYVQQIPEDGSISGTVIAMAGTTEGTVLSITPSVNKRVRMAGFSMSLVSAPIATGSTLRARIRTSNDGGVTYKTYSLGAIANSIGGQNCFVQTAQGIPSQEFTHASAGSRIYEVLVQNNDTNVATIDVYCITWEV